MRKKLLEISTYLKNSNTWDYLIREYQNGELVDICYMKEDSLFDDYNLVTDPDRAYIVVDRNYNQIYEITKGGGLWNWEL